MNGESEFEVPESKSNVCKNPKCFLLISQKEKQNKITHDKLDQNKSIKYNYLLVSHIKRAKRK